MGESQWNRQMLYGENSKRDAIRTDEYLILCNRYPCNEDVKLLFSIVIYVMFHI